MKTNKVNNSSLSQALKSSADKQKAEVYRRFFKTNKGEYGEKDIFLGIAVPQTRKIAKKFSNLSFTHLEKNLKSKYHEERLAALLILVEKYKNLNEKGNIIKFYLANTKNINNWDLVDLTADKILGHYLEDKSKNILYKLAESENVWERRISIISTFHLIKKNKFQDSLKISEILLKDKHDLIHKAVGWMLREIGKREMQVLENFLKKHYKNIPRTTLRYAIEKFPEEKRKIYLAGNIY